MGNNDIHPQIERVTGPGGGSFRLRRYSRYLLILVALAVVVTTLVREQGVIGTWKLSQAEKQLRAENEKLRRENERLLGEVHKLKTSSDLIEKRAREMGLVYPGEFVIDTRGDNASRQGRPAAPETAPPRGGGGRP
jgi:cell division protein FtsB